MSYSPIDSLCKSYNYPFEVLDHLKAIIAPLDDRIDSMILTGSTSRGELSYQFGETGLQLFSDYEFLVVVKPEINQDYIDFLANHWRKLEQEIGNNSTLFHIDCSIVTLNQLTKLPKVFRTFEARETGKVVYGKDVVKQIPEVTVNQLDFRELNEVILWRLWSAALYLPCTLLEKDNNAVKNEDVNRFLYTLYRNALDLTTWSLPFEGKLIAGFVPRVEYIHKNFGVLSLASYIDEDWPAWLDSCLSAKLRMEIQDVLLIKIYYRFLQQFERAINFLVKKQVGQIEPTEKRIDWLRRKSYKSFSDFNIRRKGYEIIVMSRYASSIPHFLYWLGQPKYGVLVSALVSLHKSCLAFLDERFTDADKWLRETEQDCRTLSLQPIDATFTLSESFQFRWRFWRRQIAEFMMGYFRSVSHQRGHIENQL